LTARGSDISQIGQFSIPRRLIRWAAGKADGVITVCQALKDELIKISGDSNLEQKVRVLRNGVDLVRFCQVDRAKVRTQLGVSRLTLLSVGLLIPRKGHDVIIRALAALPEAELLVVGQGPELERLQALAQSLGVLERIRFCGAVEQDALRDYYNAADIMILASSREGWANVLLESMACGTPVIASDVWGTPEVVQSRAVGRLVPYGNPEALAVAVRQVSASRIDRSAVRAYAEQFSWDATTAGQVDLFNQILLQRARG
jgi:teichuronic acid biosynthesis glycosyltransferase TuaC